MSSEIPGFSELLSQFKQSLAHEVEVREQLQKARDDVSQAWIVLDQVRQFALEDLLKQRGLQICGWGPEQHQEEETEEERLGVFPKERMHYFYIHNQEEFEAIPHLYSLCSRHFDRDMEISTKYSADFKHRWFISTVVNIGGRLITWIDNLDVTELPVQYTGGYTESRDMEKIYTFYSFPKLFPKPSFPREYK